MIIILGLVVLLAAVVVGVAGVLVNRGHSHALVHQFAVFGYHVTGSSGRLFLYGIVVGAVGVAGLGLLLAGARRTSRRGSDARRGLRQSRQETAAVSQQRDDLIGQREATRAYTGNVPGDDAARADFRPAHSHRRGGLSLFGHRSAPPEVVPDVPEVPADTPAP